jgi:acyl-CoA thioesterase
MLKLPLDEALALEPAGPDVWKGHPHPGYAGRGAPFGGVTAAQVLATVLRHPDRLGEPVALTVNFAAALAEGEFQVLTWPVRTNRSTQYWTSEMRQQGEVVLAGTAVTAVRRETWSTVEEAMPTAPRPEDCAAVSGLELFEFLKRYERRLIQGGIPAAWDGSDSGDSLTRLWLRDFPPRPIDFASLTAMCDLFFPRIWRRRATRTPFGTVSLTVYFHAGADQLIQTGTGYLLGQARTHGARAGYFDQSAQLWNECGSLLATTHQVAYFKE